MQEYEQTAVHYPLEQETKIIVTYKKAHKRRLKCNAFYLLHGSDNSYKDLPFFLPNWIGRFFATQIKKSVFYAQVNSRRQLSTTLFFEHNSITTAEICTHIHSLTRTSSESTDVFERV